MARCWRESFAVIERGTAKREGAATSPLRSALWGFLGCNLCKVSRTVGLTAIRWGHRFLPQPQFADGGIIRLELPALKTSKLQPRQRLGQQHVARYEA